MKEQPLISFKDGFWAAVGWYTGQAFVGIIGILILTGVLALLLSLVD